jgi:hypothetical protein
VFELAKLVDTLGVVESLSQRRRSPRPLGLPHGHCPRPHGRSPRPLGLPH